MAADDDGHWGLLQSVDTRLKTVGSPRTKFKNYPSSFPSHLVSLPVGDHCWPGVALCAHSSDLFGFFLFSFKHVS